MVGCSHLKRIHQKTLAIIVYMDEEYTWEIGKWG